MFVMLKIERGFTLWVNGHLTMDVIESAQCQAQGSNLLVSRKIGPLPLINGDTG